MISQSTNDVVVVCSYGGTNLVKTGWNGSVHDTVPDLQTDLPFVVCLLLFVLVVGLVFDEREAFVVVLVVDVGVVETHELAGTTVVFTVELVCVLPFESIEITSVSIADVIELHDVVDFRGARVVVLTVDVGVVDTQELAGTTVVFFVELVCVLPFESIEITSDSITDVIELHDVVDFFDGFTVDFVVDVGVVDTHELAGTTVVFFVELVCLRPFESVEITSVSITDVIELHDVVDFFDGFTVDFFVVVGVVETHELAGTTVVFFVVLVCLRPFESVEITSDSITDVIELHDFLGLGPFCSLVVERTVDVSLGETHELAGTLVVNVEVVLCVLPRESIDFRIDSTTAVEVLHGKENFGKGCDGNVSLSTVDLIVDVGVVDTHELAGNAVV